MLDQKDIARKDKDLIDLHKRCLTDYLVKRSVKLRKRNKFFILYDMFIDHNNIPEYFFTPIKLFIYALVTDRLDDIRNYYKPSNPKSKTKKNKKNGNTRTKSKVKSRTNKG